MKRLLTRLIVGHVCLHACMAGMRMAAPLWVFKGGAGAMSAGMLLALFALMQVFLALPAGRYVDRHGMKRPVRWAVLFATSGVMVAALFPSFWTLSLAALASGGATGVAAIALQKHAGASAKNPTELKQVFAWLSLGPAISNFVGPLLAGVLIDLAGFQWAFGCMATLPLMTGWLLRRVHEPAKASPVDTSHHKVSDLLLIPRMKTLLLVNWLLSSCWDVHTFVVPLLGHAHGLNASTIGAILGAFALAASAVRSIIPSMAARLHEHKVIAVAMLSTGLGFAVYPFMGSGWGMGLCSTFLGVSLGCVQPMIMSMLHQITPERRHGEALGLRLMSLNASSVLMPMVFGSLGAVVGAGGLFWLVGLLVGSGARLAWRLHSTTQVVRHRA